MYESTRPWAWKNCHLISEGGSSSSLPFMSKLESVLERSLSLAVWWFIWSQGCEMWESRAYELCLQTFFAMAWQRWRHGIRVLSITIIPFLISFPDSDSGQLFSKEATLPALLVCTFPPCPFWLSIIFPLQGQWALSRTGGGVFSNIDKIVRQVELCEWSAPKTSIIVDGDCI